MEHFPEFVVNHLFLFSLLVAISSLLIWNLFGNTMSGISEVIPMEATRLINHENAIVLDLRSENNFKDGHILNAINIPSEKLPERQNEIKKYKERPVILSCNNGAESAQASRILKHNGFEKLYCLKGGLQAWRNASLPLTREHPAEQTS
ncbi:MAG: rhodanese protein [Gammaproteobacteria bacterium]|nr:rhodanese protein [Gammaproteobacteria bacterium]